MTVTSISQSVVKSSQIGTKAWVLRFRGNREQFEMYLETLRKEGNLTIGELLEGKGE